MTATFAVYLKRPDLDDGPWRLEHACGFESLDHARGSADLCARRGYDALVNDESTGRQVYYAAAKLRVRP